MDNYCCEELPKRISAINEIRNQPYYGNDKQDFTVVYIYNHAMWYVGNYKGLMQVRGKCVKEIIALDNRLKNAR